MAKILIVDDDELTVGLICLYLAHNQHDVTTATNGKDALALINSTPFDILITDIIMPEMDGYNLIMHLLLKPAGLKIIAISAGTPVIEAALVLEAAKPLKADKVLTKPLTSDALNSAVNTLLQLNG